MSGGGRARTLVAVALLLAALAAWRFAGYLRMTWPFASRISSVIGVLLPAGASAVVA